MKLEHFFGDEFKSVEHDNTQYWIAGDVGRVLGYSQNGNTLAKKIITVWKNTVDSVVLSGAALDKFKQRNRKTHPNIKGKSLILIDRIGLMFVLLRSKKSVAKEFQRYVSEYMAKHLFEPNGWEIYDELKYNTSLNIEDALSILSKADKEKLDAKIRAQKFRDMKEMEQLRLKQNRLEHEQRLAEQMKEFEKIQEKRSIDKIERLKLNFMKNDQWMTPTAISKSTGVNKFDIGRIAKELKVRDDIPNVCRTYIVHRDDKDLKCFIYAPNTCFRIVCKAIEDGLVS